MGLMAVVTWKLATAALCDSVTVGLALLSALVIFRYNLNSAWVIIGGGVLGWLAHSIG